jgi:hypothetical protein
MKKLSQRQIVQVLGEYSPIPEEFGCTVAKFQIQVHFLRDFDEINPQIYNEAIGTQSLACPKMLLRRMIIDTINSPAPMTFLSSLPRDNNINLSKDMFECSSSSVRLKKEVFLK